MFDNDVIVWENVWYVVLDVGEQDLCGLLGVFMFIGLQFEQLVGMFFGGEKIWFVLVGLVVFIVNVLLFDELINNFDLVLCEQVFDVLCSY